MRSTCSLMLMSCVLVASCAGPTSLKTKVEASDPNLEEVPEISGVDHRGRSVSLNEMRSEGPVVVIFYRGHW